MKRRLIIKENNILTKIDEDAVEELLDFTEYRKKPIVIKAIQLNNEFEVETLEGVMRGDKGDYLIIGINGELYPCKPDIFEQTYDEV